VAVVGAGPGGLAVAKHLLEQGADPIVLERGDDLGGQWNAGSAHSAVWPGMRTNTNRTMTAFSDLEHAAGTPMFPRAEQVHAYLRRYAERFAVAPRVRTHAEVLDVQPAGDRWAVRWTEAGGVPVHEVVDGVVIASGRFGTPAFPDIPGLAAFADHGRLLHARDFRSRDELRGQRVLVLGSSISALEIASELAGDDTIAVISSCRAPRYVIPKLVAGVPSDWRFFTAVAALAGAALGPEAAGAGLRAAVLAAAGDVTAVVGPAPHPDVLLAGLSQCQHHHVHLAEGRIDPRPAPVAVEGRRVVFADGSEAEVDAIVCATGYRLDLPFLDAGTQALLGADGKQIDLHARTFHPDLPGLGFVGQFVLHGPYLPVLELQARWLAGVWAGSVPAPSHEQLRAGVAAHREARPMLAADLHHVLAAQLAGHLGVTPDLERRPELAADLLLGPLVPERYRLDGPGALPDAPERLRRALDAFGPAGRPPAGPAELGLLSAVAGALDDPALTAVADRLAGRAMPAAA